MFIVFVLRPKKVVPIRVCIRGCVHGCTYVHVCACARTYVCVRTFTCVRLCRCVYVDTRVGMCRYVYPCVCICTFVRVSVSVCTCVRTCMYVYVHVRVSEGTSHPPVCEQDTVEEGRGHRSTLPRDSSPVRTRYLPHLNLGLGEGRRVDPPGSDRPSTRCAPVP